MIRARSFTFLSEMTACGNPGSPDWIKGSVETLLKFDPDVIIVEKYSVEDEAGILANLEKNDPLWGELKAVKNKRVHLVPVSQARLNTIQSVRGAVDAIMPLAYPEVFPAPLTDEQVQKALAESK
jgi:ABC-type Fe3+-hydroxamate transport system substrate-binding protein